MKYKFERKTICNRKVFEPGIEVELDEEDIKALGLKVKKAEKADAPAKKTVKKDKK